MARAQTPQALLKHLAEAGGQGIPLDRCQFSTAVVTHLVRQGYAKISFGRLYVNNAESKPLTAAEIEAL